MKGGQQNPASHPILFPMVDSTDHVSGKTGLTPTVTITKDGGPFVAPAGANDGLPTGDASGHVAIGDYATSKDPAAMAWNSDSR